MTRFTVFLLIVFSFTVPVYADEGLQNIDGDGEEKVIRVINVPIITFSQKVGVVVAIKRNPDVLQATITQKNDVVKMDLVVRNTQSRDQAKKLGAEFVRVLKEKSLDDNPNLKGKTLGKGLYTYQIKVTRANTDVMADGLKKAEALKIDWAFDDEAKGVNRADDVHE